MPRLCVSKSATIVILAFHVLFAAAASIGEGNRLSLTSTGGVGQQEQAHTSAGVPSYGQPQPEEQYPPQEPYSEHSQYSDRHKVDVRTFDLQQPTTYISAPNDDGVFSSIFTCSTENDEPDFCLKPYPEYRHHKDNMMSDPLQDIVMFPVNVAATCTWQTTSGLCPPFVTTDCFTGTINCTLTTVAKDCGCPYEGGMWFTAEGYYTEVDVHSCEEIWPPHGDKGRRRLASASEHITYNGTATVFRAKIKLMKTVEGYEEAEGMVEFVMEFRPHNFKRRLPRASKPALASAEARPKYYDGDDPEEPTQEEIHLNHDGKLLVKGGSLKITLLEQMHY